MDLNTISMVAQPKDRSALAEFADGDAWLAGGTWLYSEPQPGLNRLIDLAGLGWHPLTPDATGLSIAATCTIADLDAFEPPARWVAAQLIGQCCRAFLASFKVWNTATVGGNLCLALPAGPMISLGCALDGVCTVWTPEGGERRLPVADLIADAGRNSLRRGELLRAIRLPRAALLRRTAFRRASLTPLGRSAVLLIGTLSPTGRFALSVTAATRRPVQLVFDRVPAERELSDRLQAEIPHGLYYDDVHGRPEWRRHMTGEFAKEIRRELAEAGA